MKSFAVYVLLCSDGSYYVGSTADVKARVQTHNAGRGPRYTACRLPVQLVYSELCQSLALARKREIQIKKWSRAKKEALIQGDMSRLKLLSKRKSS
ncbi:MAG: GIY-YIG nuclease family protein [Phycisphaeraceae bacterium]